MSYRFSFADNGVYGAADINAITARLVTGGVADSFTDGVPYNLSSINEMGALLYTDGVVPETDNSLKVTVSGDTAVIAPGTAFFASGAVMEITEGGHSLKFTAGKKQYVYLKNALSSENRCYPAISESEPEGDFVPLAEISESGEVTDTRVYAKGKLPGYASSAMYTLKIEDEVAVENGVPASKTYAIDKGYSCLLAVCRGTTDEVGKRYNYCVGIYDFAAGDYISCDYADEGNNGLKVTALTVFRKGVHHADAAVSTVAENGKAAVRLDFSYYHTGAEAMASFPISLYLF